MTFRQSLLIAVAGLAFATLTPASVAQTDAAVPSATPHKKHHVQKAQAPTPGPEAARTDSLNQQQLNQVGGPSTPTPTPPPPVAPPQPGSENPPHMPNDPMAGPAAGPGSNPGGTPPPHP